MPLLVLRRGELQDAVLKLGGHIPGLHTLAHIEAAATGAGVPLLADVPPGLVGFLFTK